jgi:hypothetical protein
MTTRLAPLPAPEGLTPARYGAAGRAPVMTTRLAPLPAPEGLTPARFGAAGRAPARARHDQVEG